MTRDRQRVDPLNAALEPDDSTDTGRFRILREKLEELRTALEDAEGRAAAEVAGVRGEYGSSARNLVDYLCMRQSDLRPLQLELWKRGLSSLGRIEGHVRDALNQVIARVDDALAHGEAASGLRPAGLAGSASEVPTAWEDAVTLLHRHTRDLLGKRPADRHVYVMVTAPAASEVDEAWVTRLLDAGMNVLRINAAHEEVGEWRRIAETARRAAEARRASLRILVDLPGPKLRTVAPRPGPRVVRWKPERDARGGVTEPCHVRLGPESKTVPPGATFTLRVPDVIWSTLRIDDELTLRDARGRRRRLVVESIGDDAGVASTDRTIYLVPGTKVRVRRDGKKRGAFLVTEVPEQPFRVRLATGDRFLLESSSNQHEAARGEASAEQEPELPRMGCSLPEVFAPLAPGARVVLDDGKIESTLERRTEHGAVLRVTHAPAGGAWLAAEKGINFPGTPIGGPTLRPDDERALEFAVSAADIVGASFVRGPDDVRALYERLDAIARPDLGVILKIETGSAFAELPAILFAAMKRYPVGVMIARGDLAVEVGFQRLAELQEEILWLCEAAHLPVVWATEVLDHLAHTGIATRAEITDAAMSVRAECVMLNKGPYIVEAATALVDILKRMEHHQYKKRNLYRRLALAIPHFVSSQR